MTQNKMTFAGVLEAYQAILVANPGMALKISTEMFAVLGADGHLHGIHASLSGKPDLGSAFDFDLSAFDSETGAWDGESPEVTRAYFETPTLVEFAGAHGFFVDWNGTTRSTQAPGEGLICDVDVAKEHVDVVDVNGFVIHECSFFKSFEAMVATGIEPTPVYTDQDSSRNCTPRPAKII